MAYRCYASITSLPYDLLLAIATHLEYPDIISLRLTCKSLHEFTVSRPVYRHLAHGLLQRCRPLPLDGFTQLSDLTNEDLSRTIDLASRLEIGWKTRAPRRARAGHRNRLMHLAGGGFYTKLRAPPEEEIDWLSPITSSYLLCATRSGRVFCWDIETDSCLAVWQPESPLELWKCRVEFESNEVYFTMADVLAGQRYEERHMEFTIMCLRFPRRLPGQDGPDIKQPEFIPLANFSTHGAVMNVFLLDPNSRVLAAYIWLAESKSIGLYVLPDWDVKEYALLDTTISCSQTGNWSCILHEDTVIIHAEDCDHAAQHLYPLSLIRQYLSPIPSVPIARPSRRASKSKIFKPAITAILPPPRTIRRRFIFPDTPLDESDIAAPSTPHPPAPLYGHAQPAPDEATQAGDPANPFRWPDWYPDSCHFVRQWWPASPALGPQAAASRRVSCTVVLLAHHDRTHHTNSYVLAQHYFSTPLSSALADDPTLQDPPVAEILPEKVSRRPGPSNARSDGMISASSKSRKVARRSHIVDGIPLRMWYVSSPFDIVCVADRTMPDDADEDDFMRERPLLAVDFGHAVWIEWYAPDEEEQARDAALHREAERDLPPLSPLLDLEGEDDTASTIVQVNGEPADDPLPPRRRGMKRRMMFSTFPAVEIDSHGRELNLHSRSSEAVVRQLEVPEELDLAKVETINIDQSQGAVFMSIRDGQIYVVYYE